jgi:hypothetical protein
MTLLLTLACSNDFMLEPIEVPVPSGDEVVVPETEDTALDTGDTGDWDMNNEEDDKDPEEEEWEEEKEEEDPAPEDDCEGTSDLIYVVGRGTETLYTFDPDTLSFTELGELDCGMWGEPNSMAVARDGVAFVRYSDETVYELDLETLACTESSYSNNGFGSFGMGYATQNAETWRDDLYIANKGAVAILDTQTWKLTGVGSMPSQSELTGNAEGELWAFLPLEQPAQLVRLDKTNASIQKTLTLPSFPDPMNIDAFAFATWDGEFYVFVREYGMGSSTDVYRVKGNGDMARVMTDIGFDIVGAGVSTCAP